MEASASLCQHPNEGQPPCGYANACCPGAAHRDANLWLEPTDYEGLR